MKIAIVVRRFSRRGGLESNVLALCKHLLARGHTVQVLCSKVEEPGLDVEIINVGAPGVFGEAAKILWFAQRAAASLHKLAPDVSYTAGHAHGVSIARLEAGMTSSYRAAMARFAPTIERMRIMFDPAERAAEAIEVRKVTGAKLVLTLSEAEKRAACEVHGLEEKRVRVVRNGVDLARYRPAGEVEREDARRRFGLSAFTVGFVGSGFVRKGLGALLNALGHRDAPRPATLLVAGTDRRASELEAVARERDLDARFLGRLDDVRPVYAAIDVLAMPSLYEPFGLVALEALASGVPVVLYEHAGASEIVPHPELVVRDPRDAGELARALARAQNVARESCRAAAERHPLERSLEQIEAAMFEVAGR